MGTIIIEYRVANVLRRAEIAGQDMTINAQAVWDSLDCRPDVVMLSARPE